MYSFNNRKSGSWNSSTIWVRQNGQWVKIGGGGDPSGGGGAIGKRFYTSGPPERSGSTITYDGDSHSSLQAAVESLNEGDTLYIDPVNDPYVERINFAGDISDHISIVSDGELSFDSRGEATIEQQGAVIRRPDEDYLFAIGSNRGDNPSLTYDTTISGSHGLGDEVLSVNDASAFSVGDIIWFEEERTPYGEPSAFGGSTTPDTTAEMREVTGISGNDLELNHQIYLPFPNNNSTTVGRVPFQITDLRVSGLQVEGDRSFTDRGRPIYFNGVNQLWADNMVVRNSTFHGIHIGRCFRPRLDKTYVYDCPDRYALSGVYMSTHMYITDIAAENINRYVVRIASAGSNRGSTDALVDGAYGTNFSATNPIINHHWGGFYIRARNVRADPGTRAARFRSRYSFIDGWREDGGDRYTIETAQRPYGCEWRNGSVTNKVDHYVFYFQHSTSSSHSAYGDERADNLLFENIDIEAYSNSKTSKTGAEQIGYFRKGDGDCIIDGLTFRDVTYDGQKITESDVKAWEGYTENESTITNLTVE